MLSSSESEASNNALNSSSVLWYEDPGGEGEGWKEEASLDEDDRDSGADTTLIENGGCGGGGGSDGGARNTEAQLARTGGSLGAVGAGAAETSIVSPQGKPAELFRSVPTDDKAAEVTALGQVPILDVRDQSAGETRGVSVNVLEPSLVVVDTEGATSASSNWCETKQWRARGSRSS